MQFVKSTMRKVLPKILVSAYHDLRQRQLASRNSRLTTEEVFTDIYLNNRWGGESGTFCSGDGSHETAVVSPYISAVTSELERIGAAALTVVDLGCGDYSVGQQLSPSCGKYIGIDIVKPLVTRNRVAYENASVSFQHANIVDDALPDGDICFVRQVLQHLSNEQIAVVLPKLDKYTWCFITEHHPSPSRFKLPNAEKSTGDQIRISAGSGVFLDQPPFSIAPARLRLLLEVPGVLSLDGLDAGVIRTYILSQDRDRRTS